MHLCPYAGCLYELNFYPASSFHDCHQIYCGECNKIFCAVCGGKRCSATGKCSREWQMRREQRAASRPSATRRSRPSREARDEFRTMIGGAVRVASRYGP